MMKLLSRSLAQVANRKRIQPEPFQITPLEAMFKVTSNKYEFVIDKKPLANVIYEHDCSTPSRVLQKGGIHLFPQSIPEVNRRQKYAAVVRQLQSNYQNSFRNCKTGKEIFHLQRKIKSEIRRQLYFIGSLDGKKYMHLLKYKPFMEFLAQNTQKQYQKNGIEVEALGDKIYPHGKVWMPTSQRYLLHYLQIINGITGKSDPNFLDLGCGSGVLSYIFAKRFKKSNIVAVDKNTDAVKTTNINAARLSLRNVEAVQFDLKDQQKFELKMSEFKKPHKFDWIVINPPWLVSSKIEGESALADAVYDDSLMLKNSLKLAKRVLSPEGRVIVIYSDLSELLGLGKETIDAIYNETGWVVVEKQQQLLQQQMGKKSALNQFKSRSKIVTYQLKKS